MGKGAAGPSPPPPLPHARPAPGTPGPLPSPPPPPRRPPSSLPHPHACFGVWSPPPAPFTLRSRSPARPGPPLQLPRAFAEALRSRVPGRGGGKRRAGEGRERRGRGEGAGGGGAGGARRLLQPLGAGPRRPRRPAPLHASPARSAWDRTYRELAARGRATALARRRAGTFGPPPPPRPLGVLGLRGEGGGTRSHCPLRPCQGRSLPPLGFQARRPQRLPRAPALRPRWTQRGWRFRMSGPLILGQRAVWRPLLLAGRRGGRNSS